MLADIRNRPHGVSYFVLETGNKGAVGELCSIAAIFDNNSN